MREVSTGRRWPRRVAASRPPPTMLVRIPSTWLDASLEAYQKVVLKK
jgi:hypothetical protein